LVGLVLFSADGILDLFYSLIRLAIQLAMDGSHFVFENDYSMGDVVENLKVVRSERFDVTLTCLGAADGLF
jgi:hypothetical protein